MRKALKRTLRYLTALIPLVLMTALLEVHVTHLGDVRMATETKSAFQVGDTLAFGFAGRVASHSPDAQHLVFDGDLTSLATGDKAGTFSWDLTCGQAVGFPCVVYEVTNTFRLAGGTLVSRGMPNVAPALTGPGFFHVGIHPTADNIVEATGVFSGRTGRAHMSGRHGAQEFPAFVSFDDFWLVELNAKA